MSYFTPSLLILWLIFTYTKLLLTNYSFKSSDIDTTIAVTSELIYYIQFLSSTEKLTNNHKIYKDFPSDSISYYSFNNAYRYIYGHFTNFNQARDKLNYVKQKGYKDAFIVKFKDGKRVF